VEASNYDFCGRAKKSAFVERLALWKQPLAVLFNELGKTPSKKISERRVLYNLL
jgi:hypothetical protein